MPNQQPRSVMSASKIMETQKAISKSVEDSRGTMSAIRGDLVALGDKAASSVIVWVIGGLIVMAIGVAGYLIDQRSAERQRAFAGEIRAYIRADIQAVGEKVDQHQKVIEAISGHLGALADKASLASDASLQALSRADLSQAASDEAVEKADALATRMMILTRYTHTFVAGLGEPESGGAR